MRLAWSSAANMQTGWSFQRPWWMMALQLRHMRPPTLEQQTASASSQRPVNQLQDSYGTEVVCEREAQNTVNTSS